MSGWVTVTGPPASICALNFGTTEPFEASTLPNRTAISRIGAPAPATRRAKSASSAWQYISAKPLGGAEHRDRLDRLVGRDHHHGGGAGGDRGVGHVDRAEHVGLDALVPVALEQRHVLERGGMKHDVRPELLDEAEDPVAVADVGDAAVDLGVGVLASQAPPAPRAAPAPNSRSPAGARRRRSRADRRFRRRSIRRRR